MKKSAVKFTTAQELEELANQYFSKYPYIDDVTELSEIAKAKDNLAQGILPTISGLCYYIGLTSINDWQTLKNKQKYKACCEKIILRLSRYWESASATGRGQTGVTNWLNAFAGFPQAGETAQNKGVCAVVVIGADGSRQALSDIISATQAQRIQGTRTIDITAEEVKPKALARRQEITPKKPAKPSKAKNTRTRAAKG